MKITYRMLSICIASVSLILASSQSLADNECSRFYVGQPVTWTYQEGACFFGICQPRTYGGVVVGIGNGVVAIKRDGEVFEKPCSSLN